MAHMIRPLTLSALVCVCASFGAGPPPSASGAPPKNLAPVSASATAEALEAIRAKNACVGLVAGCVNRDGTVESLDAVGVRKAGETSPLLTSDRMHLGSCTKAMTATLAAVLVSDGTLKWASTVGDVLGKVTPTIDAGWRNVTLEQLLRHRGGAPAAANSADWSAAWQCTDSPEKCRQAFVNALLSRPPAQTPGTHAYSNQGYALAGHMCEVAAGEPYEALLVKRVFQPLGLTNAGFGQPSKSDPNSPVGHAADGKVNDTDNPNAITPAGRVHMPLADWMKFVAFHLGGTPPAALRGAATQLGALHKINDQAPREAMGWFSANRDWGGAVLTHSGSNTVWYCTVWMAPERGFAIVAAANQGGSAGSKSCDEACAAMIQARMQREVAKVLERERATKQ